MNVTLNDRRSVASLIDHTILKPEATRQDVERLCREAIQHEFASVCVNPVFAALVSGLLQDSRVKTCAVIGFPLGANLTATKVEEARAAIGNGARELDMVLHVGALKSGDDGVAAQDIKAVVDVCHAARAVCKVILETALLTDAEKERACILARDAGADFVKTSTGFGSGGATVSDVGLMRRVVGPSVGVKASGGVRSFDDVLKMVEAGANRIGTSSGVKILEEASAKLGR